MEKQLLTISYGNQLHKCQLDPKKEVTIGGDLSHTVTYDNLADSLQVIWKEDAEQWFLGDLPLALNERLNLETSDGEKIQFYLTEDLAAQVFDTTTKYSITFGEKDFNDVVIAGTTADLLFIREELGATFKLNVYGGIVYHNYYRVESECLLQAGDQLYFDGVTIRVGKEDIEIIAGDGRVHATLAQLVAPDNAFSADYPDYHRSPRIIYRAPETSLTIAKPPGKPSKPSEELMKILIPPLIMIAMSIVMMFLRPNPIFVLMTLGMTGATVIFSVTTYVKNRKKYKVDMKERDASYRRYLKDKTSELHAAAEEQAHSLHYHFPTVTEIRDMALSIDSRIYEKTMFHHDFLQYRVGTGEENTSFQVEFQEEEFTQDKDELVESAKGLKSQYYSVKDVPMGTDLMNGPVGYIGHRALVIEQLQLMVMQTALFHSYYDLQFITVFPEEEKEQWDWMRWLPHASLRDINVRGFVYHERSRDQVLNSLYQILKERKMALEEKGNKSEQMYFSPHYVVLVTDEKLMMDHTVMEFFNEDPSEYGVSLVFVQDVMQSLPEHVKTVIDIRDAKNGNVILEQGELVNRGFTLDHFPADFDKESVSRALAPLNHLQNLKNSIPESVTFLEMYGVDRVEELGISARWEKNETYKSLAVPLGLRGKDDIVNLNLHEKAHGPHGLVAGTTGSGKSEIIQSYIISLAVNFHPYEVAFLLIDYKGGGMANLFRNLPHLLGTITNLDGAQSMRALASIKAELQKRQRLFGEHDVNHINQYQKLYKLGEASEAMPHLFLISDEFAELKSEQPEFMKELVSTARIGRSLGIHLILATQKPSGVVDDQIWSNSKFKLALKVQNASDSNEILKTPDAAEITLPGRSYLQVGNNEIYELFQSAWSGADYVPDKDDQEQVDTTIYAINDLGQYEILTEDLSGLGDKEDISKVPSELDAVIDYIHDYTEEANIAMLPRPWLPPLPEQVFAQDLHPVDFEKAWQEPKKSLRATIGLLDQPEIQAQNPLTLDLTKDGHVAVFSSPGYGKSTFLQSVIMDLARQHNPEQLHVYLLDFGTNGLLPLKEVPHVADTITIDEFEKCTKFINMMLVELKSRKKLLSKFGVANVGMYERASQQEIPNILITIDNFDAVRDAGLDERFQPLISQIAREGSSVGIYLMISGGRQNVLNIQLVANIKTQIALYLIEENEPKSIVGRTTLKIEDMMGRGLVKVEDPTIFQTVLPNRGSDVLEIISGIQEEGKAMDASWSGEKPLAIPMVPEELTYEEFVSWRGIEKIGSIIPLGLEKNQVTPVGIDLREVGNFVIAGLSKEDGDNTIRVMLKYMLARDSYEIGIIDTKKREFSAMQGKVKLYVSGKESIVQLLEQLNGIVAKREEAYKLEQQENPDVSPEHFITKFKPIVIFIADSSDLVDEVDDRDWDNVVKLMKTGAFMGVNIVSNTLFDALDSRYDVITKYLKVQSHVLLFRSTYGQSMFDVTSKDTRATIFNPQEAYLISDRVATKIKLPLWKEE
ncbi:FtsK/SpoIIIE family DNA segregation ATPase [Listeria grandensis FSL F6-0971]|uniref:FtsK/SpoIIIE family DNA segregation ATPase n=1 Tax=Listeria grandensis FSL F6-0971 TaxID=1265819 RepID=W7BK09_9LIST|nr:type VII secretion protein EssC [Listeria grandensis]EUJ23536.1 FtsK/SpoIIIE family DNA segregation ATPase [Listeria grandensis FSL F6-0971]